MAQVHDVETPETLELLVTVVTAPDEADTVTTRQQELWAYKNAVEASAIQISPRYLFQDAAETAVTILNEFKVILPLVTPLAAVVLGAWINGRAGRKVRIKVKDVEVEASSVEDVERLLDLISERRP